MVDKALAVRERGANRIVAVSCPIAVAVAALIERDAVEVVAQREADEIPGVRGQCAAMQKDDRRPVLVAPVEVMEPHPAEVKFMALRQHDLAVAEAEAGADGGRGKVLAVFLGRQAHGGDSSFGDVSPRALARNCRQTLVPQRSRAMRPGHEPGHAAAVSGLAETR